MNLKQPFFKLPVFRDVSMATKEVIQGISESDWIGHPSGFPGNSYIPLTSHNGTINNLKRTPVKPTTFSDQLPAVTQLLKSFNLTIGISRLMRLEGGYDVPVHSDTNEYWDKRVRMHVPLITSDKVFFACGNEEVVMAPGEVWTFNNWIKHGVRNQGASARIHLVFDTETTYVFDSEGDLRKGLDKNSESDELTLEQEPTTAIKSTAALEESMSVLVKELRLYEGKEKEEAKRWLNLIESHQARWEAIESEYGINVSVLSKYQNAIQVAMNEAEKLNSSLRLKANNVKVEVLFKTRVKAAMDLQMLFSNGK